MRILISNTVALNGGDAAILEGTIAILRSTFGEQVDFLASGSQPEVAQRYHPAIRFMPAPHDVAAGPNRSGLGRKFALAGVLAAAALWQWPFRSLVRPLVGARVRALLDTYASATFVVSAGGTYLVPHYSMSAKLYDFLVTLALGRPLVLFTQSLGPFENGRKRWLLKFALRRARMILVRDERSRDHLEPLGVRANVRQAADAAFALARSPHGSARPEPQRPPRIAVSVRDWPHQGSDTAAALERYKRALAEFLGDLIERTGAQVTFLSTCQGIEEYWTDDSALALEIVERMPEPLRARVTVDRSFHRPTELVARFAAFDAVIATRMHAAILSLCAGTPVLAIAYEFKTRELFERLGFGQLVLEYGAISAAGLSERWNLLWNARESVAARVRAAVEEERRSSFQAGHDIADALALGSAAEGVEQPSPAKLSERRLESR